MIVLYCLLQYVLNNPGLVNTTPFLAYADNFVCDVLPESPIKSFKYSPGIYVFLFFENQILQEGFHSFNILKKLCVIDVIFMVIFMSGGLMFKPGGCNMQHTTTLSFLTLTYAGYIQSSKRIIHCKNVNINSERLIQFSKTQVTQRHVVRGLYTYSKVTTFLGNNIIN